jgi:hypothetical protein
MKKLLNFFIHRTQFFLIISAAFVQFLKAHNTSLVY